MGRSLDVFHVRLDFDLDAAVGKFLIVDLVFAVQHGASASPVPVKATYVLKSGHLFISEICEDLDHVASVSIDSVDVVLKEVTSPDTLLKE